MPAPSTCSTATAPRSAYPRSASTPLARVSTRATARVHGRRIGVSARSFAKTFFIGILDLAQDDGLRILKRSVDAELLKAAGVLDELGGKRKRVPAATPTSSARPHRPPNGRTVYTLYQDSSTHGTVTLDRPSLRRLSDAWRTRDCSPIVLRATSDFENPPGDYPGSFSFAPIFSSRAAEALRELLESAGRLLPFQLKGRTYFLYDVVSLVDCLDNERSSPFDHNQKIARPVFVPEKLPRTAPAFRLTQTSRQVFWTDAAVERFRALPLVGVEYRPLWSEDPRLEIPPTA